MKIFVIVIAGLICVLMTIVLANMDQKVVVHEMIDIKTPAQNHEPMIGDNWEKWHTEFRFFYNCPEPSGFEIKEYKKTHPYEVPILKKVGNENFVTVYSDLLPNKKIFPFPIKWGEDL